MFQHNRQSVASLHEIPMRCVLHTYGAPNLIQYDEYTHRWLTDDRLQMLTQSCRETSLSPDDVLDN